ncbi:MAG: S8 family serine peptidase [Bacteroidales bacterium]|jgi:subtilisin family serine protease|nr:S8 family serine peptidase [Bacteroidales bacterium]
MKNSYCIFWLSLIGLSISGGLNAQDRNNQHEVVQLDPQISHAGSVANEVLVKFKAGTAAQMQQIAPKRMQAGLSAVDAVLSHYDIEVAEQLLPNDNPGRMLKSTKAYSGNDVVETSLNQLYRLQVAATSAKSSFELIEELKALPEVEFAEPNYIVSALGRDCLGRGAVEANSTTTVEANDPLYPQQWGIPAVALDALYTKPVLPNAPRKVIAILDTGVDPEHPDLAANIWTNPGEQGGAVNYDNDGNGFKNDLHGWDFVNKTATVNDFNSHGTHCAGIAAAVADNSIGIAGANPNALIMPLAVLQSNGQGDVATIIQGINYAKNNGADIISMSFGTYAHSIALEQALAQAYQNCVLVAAAGNDALGIYPLCGLPTYRPMFPAAYTFVLGVQASQQNDAMSVFSNFDCDGATFSQTSEEQQYNYELMAPGTGIISTVPNGQYRSYNGTSMACPLVAGGISALLDRKNFVSQEELWANLIQSSNSNGIVDFNAACSFVLQPQLHIIAIETNDTLNGDGDMRADAGELLQIYPTLKNTGGVTGGENDTIYYKLEFAEFEDANTATILNGDTKFGYILSAYSKMKAANPINLQISPDVVDGRVIKFVLTAWRGNHLGEVSQEFQVYVENGVELSGMLMHNDTLTADKHYIVTDNFAIPEGVTLVIKPGTVLKFKDNVRMSSAGQIKAVGTPDSLIYFTKTDLGNGWGNIWFSNYSYTDSLKYCVIEYVNNQTNNQMTYNMSDIIFRNNTMNFSTMNIFNSNISNNRCWVINSTNFEHCNIVNNDAYRGEYGVSYDIKYFRENNIFSNSLYSIHLVDATPAIYYQSRPSYHGSSVETIARKGIFDFYTPNSGIFGVYDLSNMLIRPYAQAHGIVWKVVVNGYDAQDEFDMLPPLGVGTHEFKVYFNRAMDTLVAPMVAMGVRPPYTQNAIAENGHWIVEDDSTYIYVANFTVKAASTTDGLNRIYVANAQDNEHFEIPYENQRFNAIVQAAGSMSNGFMATPAMGKINLEWEKPEGYFDDLLGYNMYRYVWVTDSTTSDTLMINTSLLSDTLYTDFDVMPGKTYGYMYKVMRTDLAMNDYSKTVSASPLTAAKGDANGSLSIDVADIVSTVSHITGGNPQPFIFEAADVNSDGVVNVLDIVAIVNLILNPQPAPQGVGIASTATYSIESDTLFIESPATLGGVQFKIHADKNAAAIRPLAALSGFENVSQWLDDTTYLLLAFSMTGNEIPAGRNALLQLGEGSELAEIIACNPQGDNIPIVNAPTGIPTIETVTIAHNCALKVYPNPFRSALHVQVTTLFNTSAKLDLEFTDLAGRQLHKVRALAPANGVYEYIWNAAGLPKGLYFCTLKVNNEAVKTEKVIFAGE